MKKILLTIFAFTMLSACSELELGSHLAKQMWSPDSASAVGSFKVGSGYKIKGRTYYPTEQYQHTETGIASWYGPGFHGKLTANGEIFNKYDLTAAHRTLQLPSIIKVTNLENGKSIIVRVNDRGPFAHDRILDLSEKAAEVLGMKHKGTAKIRLDVLEDESRQVASAAKQGKSTRGAEIALNKGLRIQNMDMQIATPVSKPMSASRPVKMGQIQKTIPKSNLFDEILIKQVNASPVRKPLLQPQIVTKPVGDVFVQAGAFASEDNAMTMKMALYNISEPVSIDHSMENGSPLYRVKIGPVGSVQKADEISRMLKQQGRDAKVMISQK